MSQLLETVGTFRREWFANCYYGRMERVIDKSIVLACCLLGLVLVPWNAELLAALLLGIAIAAFSEVAPKRVSLALLLVFVGVALVIPAFGLLVPLVGYDLVRQDRGIVRFSWLLPVAVSLVRLPVMPAVVLLVACGIALLLSLRTARTIEEKETYWRLRNDVRESSLSLEEKNRGLREKQDMEVHLATLAERERIAREIHDNVGHLLTRSIMQVEALQVVHRGEASLPEELEQVGATLHEAMNTVRESVHNLHDDAFSLKAKIEEAAEACAPLLVEVDYHTDAIPRDIGYCFLAIVREALSNVAKHSDASRVVVTVKSYPAFFRLVVHDNGSAPSQGRFPQNTAVTADILSASKGIGLITMADRARALGGMLRIDRDRGFKVFVTVPREGQE